MLITKLAIKRFSDLVGASSFSRLWRDKLRPKSKYLRHWTLNIGLWAVLITSYFLLPTPCLYAVPHINGKNMGPKEYVHQPVLSPSRGITNFAIARSVAATGTRKIAVILVDFASAGSSTSGSNSMTTSDITGLNNTFNYLRDFYSEESCGKLNIDITIYYSNGSTTTLTGNETPYTLSNSMSYYGEDTNSSLSQLVIDALGKVGGTVKHTSVADGTYDGVMVAHAGYGNESTSNAGDVWSAYVGPFPATNGFIEGTIVPARESSGASPIGVTCHEFGHHLGLWDLYATDSTGGVTQVGDWSLMDNGAWLGSPAGSQPSHSSAWEKKQLLWLDFIEISSGTNNLKSYAFETSSATVFKLKMVNTETEYFVVYFTSKTAKSPSNPGTGLLIWHIDEGDINGVTLAARMENNALNNYSHRTVDLEEADDSDPSTKLKPPYGDSTDPWPGTRTTFTIPYSNNYQDQPSMVTVSSITNYTNYSNFTVYYRPFVSGYVRNSAGTGIENVSITAVSSTRTITTSNSDGYYIFTDLDQGSYAVTPSKNGWHFDPDMLAVTVETFSITNNNFIGAVDKTFLLIDEKPNFLKPVNNLFTPGLAVTTVWYKTARTGLVTINLYTLDGRLVKTLVDENISAGKHSVQWDGKNDSYDTVSSGIYLLHISAPGYKETKKICVIR